MKKRRRQCPGHCGRILPRNVFACGDCWSRVPASMRRPISSTIGKPPSLTKKQAWQRAENHLAGVH